MAVAVVRGENTLIWSRRDFSYPEGVSAIHTVTTERGLQAALRDTGDQAVAYLKIRYISERMITLIQEIGRGRRSNRLHVGRLILEMKEIRVDQFHRLVKSIFVSSITYQQGARCFGQLEPWVIDKFKENSKIDVDSFKREMVVVKALDAKEDASYQIRVKNLKGFTCNFEQVQILCFQQISLVGILHDMNHPAWQVINRVREIHIFDCSASDADWEQLFCFFAWAPKLQKLSIILSPEDKENLVVNNHLLLASSQGISFNHTKCSFTCLK